MRSAWDGLRECRVPRTTVSALVHVLSVYTPPPTTSPPPPQLLTRRPRIPRLQASNGPRVMERSVRCSSLLSAVSRGFSSCLASPPLRLCTPRRRSLSWQRSREEWRRPESGRASGGDRIPWRRRPYDERSSSSPPPTFTLHHHPQGEYLYGLHPALAALEAGKRLVHRVFVQEDAQSMKKGERRDGAEEVGTSTAPPPSASVLSPPSLPSAVPRPLAAALRRLQQHPAPPVQSLSRQQLNLLSGDRPHNGVVLDVSPLPCPLIDRLPSAPSLPSSSSPPPPPPFPAASVAAAGRSAGPSEPRLHPPRRALLLRQWGRAVRQELRPPLTRRLEGLQWGDGKPPHLPLQRTRQIPSSRQEREGRGERRGGRRVEGRRAERRRRKGRWGGGGHVHSPGGGLPRLRVFLPHSAGGGQRGCGSAAADPELVRGAPPHRRGARLRPTPPRLPQRQRRTHRRPLPVHSRHSLHTATRRSTSLRRSSRVS